MIESGVVGVSVLVALAAVFSGWQRRIEKTSGERQ
jgi:hypothetical protein